MNIIEKINSEQLRADIPAFKAGDTIKVHARIVTIPTVTGLRPWPTWTKKSQAKSGLCWLACSMITGLTWTV